MNDENVLADFTFGPIGWFGIIILALCTVVAIKIMVDIARVEYRVWRVRRKK